MGKIGWLDNDLNTVWVVCDECSELNRKMKRSTKNHWTKAGNIAEVQKKLKEGRMYCMFCSNGHEIEIDSLRFLRKERRPRV